MPHWKFTMTIQPHSFQICFAFRNYDTLTTTYMYKYLGKKIQVEVRARINNILIIHYHVRIPLIKQQIHKQSKSMSDFFTNKLSSFNKTTYTETNVYNLSSNARVNKTAVF